MQIWEIPELGRSCTQECEYNADFGNRNWIISFVGVYFLKKTI